MKRFLATMLAALMLCATTAFAADYTLSVSTSADEVVSVVENAAEGDLVKVYVRIDNNANLGSAAMKLKYDTNLFELVDDPDCIADADDYGFGDEALWIPYAYYIESLDWNSRNVFENNIIGENYINGTEQLAIAYVGARGKNFTRGADDLMLFGATLKVKAAGTADSVIELVDVDLADKDNNKFSFDANKVTVKFGAPAPTTANVTVTADENVVYTASATGTLDIGTEVTVTAKPKAGYVIDAANFGAIGGTYTFTVEADTEIVINAAEVTEAAATVAAVYKDDETELDAACGLVYMFGKAPAAATDFGIEIAKDGEAYTFVYNKNGVEYGPKFAAKSKSAEGFYGISIYNMAAGEYTINAYAEGYADGAAYTFTKQ